MNKLESVDDFDWVTARAQCSSLAVFASMKMDAEKDVNLRKKFLVTHEEGRCTLSFNRGSSTGEFSVTVNGRDIRGEHTFDDEVTFRRTADGVTVVDRQGAIFLNGILCLSDEGQCKLKVENEELNFWQFRKKALEHVLFDGVRMALYGKP
jgi:hypothetical protein